MIYINIYEQSATIFHQYLPQKHVKPRRHGGTEQLQLKDTVTCDNTINGVSVAFQYVKM
jgi:hypothetical protein